MGGNAPDLGKGYDALKTSHPDIDYLGKCWLVPIKSKLSAETSHEETETKMKGKSESRKGAEVRVEKTTKNVAAASKAGGKAIGNRKRVPNSASTRGKADKVDNSVIHRKVSSHSHSQPYCGAWGCGGLFRSMLAKIQEKCGDTQLCLYKVLPVCLVASIMLLLLRQVRNRRKESKATN